MRNIKEKGLVDLQVHSPPYKKESKGMSATWSQSSSSLTQWLLNSDRDHLHLIAEFHQSYFNSFNKLVVQLHKPAYGEH